ncbi:MAG: FtsX-like permease family protein [Lacipirellulaceae bacterium]
MSFWKIAWKNLLERRVASFLTALSMALGVAAMVCVLVVHAVTVRQFSGDAQGYNLIVGGKGGDLQLVLSTVYHLGRPLFPIPYADYRKFTDGPYASLTTVAVPYCLGDSFDPRPSADGPSGRLFRVVATTPDLFDKVEYGTNSDGSPRKYTFREGRNFRTDHAFEGVVGSVVAAQAGLKAGDTINPTHGISGEGDKHDEFIVVGVLTPTGTANDRAVFVNIEGFYLLEGHALSPKAITQRAEVATESPMAKAAGAPKGTLPPATLYDNDDQPIAPLPEAQREVTSILILCDNVLGPTVLSTKINKDATQALQAVAPALVVTSLLEGIVGPLQVVLLVLTILVIVVAAIGVLVSIYNSMAERAHDIAVMRSLGASRTAVMLIVLSEAVLLAVAGGLLGVLLGHGLVALAAPYVEGQTGVRLAFWDVDPWEVVVVPGLVALAALAGLIPALAAYRTDVAKALAGAR